MIGAASSKQYSGLPPTADTIAPSVTKTHQAVPAPSALFRAVELEVTDEIRIMIASEARILILNWNLRVYPRLRWLPRAGREMVFVINREFLDYNQMRSFKSVSSDIAFKYSYTFRF